jgi:hypothetical protein
MPCWLKTERIALRLCVRRDTIERRCRIKRRT